MPVTSKKWEVATPAPDSHLNRFPTLSPLLVQVLYNRGVREPQEIEGFLAGHWQEADVFSLPDMARAVDVLVRAIKRRDPIAVYGDFDTDGVTATALLVQALTGLGAEVRPYIPHRVDEGYGLNLEALRGLYGKKVRLVVTVDCGIRAVAEIEQARRGLEFVITDHHSMGSELPFALAVVNPKREDNRYPFRDFAGVGVAFKLAQALIREAPRCDIPVHVEERSLLDLVAIGTVADVVPLLGENRYLVQQGLKVLNEARREGLHALLRVAGISPGRATAATIGFGLGPRLNAAGRLGDALLSYNLLITPDRAKAEQLAVRLNEQNRRRQALTLQAYERAEKMALAEGEDVPIMYAADETFVPGIVGLVAGRFTETYYRPSVIVEKGNEICKGSCRSIQEFHITQALDECRDLLLRYGGHAAAAGFTVRRENLDPLMRRLFGIARRELGGKELFPRLDIDAVVPLVGMDWSTAAWIQELEPCGERNPPPLFLSRDVQVSRAYTVGSDSSHLRMDLVAEDEGREAIAFGMGHRLAELGSRVDLVYSLEVNEWNGERRLQLNVQDARPAEA